MNRRNFLAASLATSAVRLSVLSPAAVSQALAAEDQSGVAILLVDTDRIMGSIDERIYGQFLEHINHSVEDGLFAEQIRGAGFEGDDFKTYWQPFSGRGVVEIAELEFQNGKKSVRLAPAGGHADTLHHRLWTCPHPVRRRRSLPRVLPSRRPRRRPCRPGTGQKS